MFLQILARMRNENTELGKPGTIPGVGKCNKNHRGVQTSQENFCAIVSVQDQEGSREPPEPLDAARNVCALAPVVTSPVHVAAASATAPAARGTRVSPDPRHISCSRPPPEPPCPRIAPAAQAAGVCGSRPPASGCWRASHSWLHHQYLSYAVIGHKSLMVLFVRLD